MRAVGAAFLGFFLWCSVRAQGALYEFTLEGEVTYAPWGWGGVQVGDPVVIRYTADSQDTNPDPMIGVYNAGRATMIFPSITVQTANSDAPLYVALNGSGVEVIQYLNVGPGYGLDVVFRFPDGTIHSDALPFALPLESAIRRSLSMFEGGSFHDILRGNITSYTSTEVPEPAPLSVIPFALILIGRSRRKNGIVQQEA